jgi:hypothetical protein
VPVDEVIIGRSVFDLEPRKTLVHSTEGVGCW